MFSLFFLSYYSRAFIALVGYESRGLEHFVCSCHCIWCISLSSLRGFVVVSEVEKIVTREFIGTLELVPLGCVGPQRLVVVAELNHYGVKLRDATGASNSVVEIAPRICTGTVTAPKGCQLYGFGDRPQVSHSGITASCIGKSVRRNRVDHVGFM